MPRKAKSKKVEETYEELIVPEDDYASQAAKPLLYRRLAIGFLAAIVLLLIFAAVFVRSQANILIVVKPQTLSVSNIITVASQPVGANSIAGSVLSTEVNDSQEFAPEAKNKEPAKAAGRVTVFNKSKKSQSLVATTRLLSVEQVLFRLTKTILVPAGGQVEAEVVADQPGVAGEIAPTRFTIPGLLSAMQPLIYAASTSPMTGGQKTIAALSAADVERAKNLIIEALFQKAQSKLKEMSQAAGQSYDQAEFALVSGEAAPEEKLGKVLDKFKMNGKVTALGVFYNQADLNRVLSVSLKSTLSAGEIAARVSPLPTVKLENYDLTSGQANLRAVQEVGVSQSREDLVKKSRLADLTPHQAADYFKSYSSVSKVSVRLEPFWVKKIPRDETRITITVVNE